MHIRRNFMLMLMLLLTFFVTAQQKRALIIAINNYYSEPGKPDEHISLKGCVNDAKLMKGILMTRFGFKNSEIREVYNDSASRKNVLAKMNELLAMSKAGDVAVIYYSGHGMLLKNSFSDKDIVNEGGKMMGHNQGMLTSDLYSTNASLIRDHEISRIANRFIDKNVTLTLIFDCCYSQSLLRGEEEENVTWDIEQDKMGEELPRFADPENMPASFKEALFQPVDDSGVVEARNIPFDQDILDKDRIVRPAERPNSGFVYFAASSGLDKSFERNNISNIKHGIFTQVLCEVLKELPASASLATIQKRIAAKLQGDQFITAEKQNPNVQADPARYKMNLLGLPNNVLSNGTSVNYIRTAGNDIVIDGGASVGLAKGNLLTYSKANNPVSIRVTDLIGVDSAKAIIVTGNKTLLKPWVKFKVTDWYAQSDPLLKIYVPDDNYTMDQLYTFLKTQVLPLKLSNKTVWFDKSDNDCVQLYCTGDGFYVNNLTSKKYPLRSFTKEGIDILIGDKRYFINLPVPSVVSKAVKEKLSKDQNVQLVNSIYEADAYLYCSYSPVNNALVFTLSSDIITNAKSGLSVHRISGINTMVDPETIKTAKIPDLSEEINKVVLQYASHSRWLNKYPKR